MRISKGLWLFYQKLIIPSIAFSVLLSIFFSGLIPVYMGIGISFVVLTPVIHYFSYDVRSPNEYYFYHNLGLSKVALWANTLGISFVLTLILLAI